MIPVSLQQITQWLGGELTAEPERIIRSVSTDTRQIATGDLFVALAGERFDAHDFAEQAITAGAAALVVNRKLELAVPQIVVTDTRKALGQLAAGIRKLWGGELVAITGSCGKTTVKEMLTTIFQQVGNTLATQGNFNNDIGVPLTLLRLEHRHEHAVIEMGANHIGEIGYTTKLAAPQVALITNVAPAHLEGFGSIQGVAQAKGEIFSGLTQAGTAVIEFESPYYHYWTASLVDQNLLTWSLCGEPSADLRVHQLSFDKQNCASFVIEYRGSSQPISLPLPGKHNVANAVAAAAASIAMGLGLEQVARGLASMGGIAGRLNPIVLNDDVLILDDSYNANLASVNAAIDVLAGMETHTALVLGDMAELGSEARRCHQQVGEYAKQQQLDGLFTVGELTRNSAEAFYGEKGNHAATIDALLPNLVQWIANHQPLTLVVKGSRSARMERVIEALQQQQSECGEKR